MTIFTDAEGNEFQAVQYSNDECLPAIEELVGDLLTISPTGMAGLAIIQIGGTQLQLNAGDYLVREETVVVDEESGEETIVATAKIVSWHEFQGTTTEEVISEGLSVDLGEPNVDE